MEKGKKERKKNTLQLHPYPVRARPTIWWTHTKSFPTKAQKIITYFKLFLSYDHHTIQRPCYQVYFSHILIQISSKLFLRNIFPLVVQVHPTQENKPFNKGKLLTFLCFKKINLKINHKIYFTFILKQSLNLWSFWIFRIGRGDLIPL